MQVSCIYMERFTCAKATAWLRVETMTKVYPTFHSIPPYYLFCDSTNNNCKIPTKRMCDSTA